MTTNYQSTRNNQTHVTGTEAILTGLSPDGGLFVLPTIPDGSDILMHLKELSYQDIATRVLTLFFPELTSEQCKQCVGNAYDHSFSHSKVTPLVTVGDRYVLELFHGPTSAFKDVALSLLPQLMATAALIQGIEHKLLILTATSGDTGKAALEGFKDNSLVDLLVFYPSEGVSVIQKQQMQTQEGHNLDVIGISGNFDDAQSGIKELFHDHDILEALDKTNYQLSSANSVNIGRLVPQIVYYFHAYQQLLLSGKIASNDVIDVVVPTGNFGNILAGYYAKKMGLPIRKLVCASNQNHILADFIATGVYDIRRDFVKTSSPSMDILISSNMERLLFHISGNDTAYVAECMDQLKTAGMFTLRPDLLSIIQEDFIGGFVTDDQVSKTIRETLEEEDYLLDPHTAVAYHMSTKLPKDQVPKIILGTASPYKFIGSLIDALPQLPNDLDDYSGMAAVENLTGVPIPKPLAQLKDKEIYHPTMILKEDMKTFLLKQLEVRAYDSY